MKKRIIAFTIIISLLSLTACSNQATTSEPEPQTETISTEAETEQISTEPETETTSLEEETTETETETTKADEQLQSEAGQTTSEESNYTVTPMTATMYAQQAVNLRQGPGTTYDKTGSLSTNQSVEVTGYTDVASGKWYQLSNGSFVSSKYLSTDKVAVQAPTTNNSTSSNSSNSSGSSQSSSSSSEGQTVTGPTGDGSGSSRGNYGYSDGTGGSDSLAGMGNLQ